jgi:hypothetical protein
MFSVGLMYMNYGTFDGYEPNGDATGTFKANEQALHLSYARQLAKKWRAGASAKLIYSNLESYVSSGLAADIGLSYVDSQKQLISTLNLVNAGVQVLTYRNTDPQPLATALNWSISKRLEHVPFRYNLVIHDLQLPDMRYEFETNETDEFGNKVMKKMTWGDNALRHINLGGELYIGKNINVQFGYNHQRRREMAPEIRRGTTGFSWGLGVNLGKVFVSYASSAYFPGFKSNMFTFRLDLTKFYRKS